MTLRITLLGISLFSSAFAGEPLPHLPGEPSAGDILDGKSVFPPSPTVEVPIILDGLDPSRLGKLPAPGVHPRILISPDQLPDLRDRLKNTNTGRLLYQALQTRLDESLRNPAYPGSRFYEVLAAGELDEVKAWVEKNRGLPPGVGHYQPFLYVMVIEALDALILEDKERGGRAASALATYSRMILPGVEKAGAGPMGDDSWRAKTLGSHTGASHTEQGLRDGVGGHLLGYAYDFAFPFMNDAQRDIVRKTISTATASKLWIGARLPRHFRNWNWIAVGLQQPLLALAIEGEKGYDPRVYELGVQMARDYLTYGISAQGVSTEAVGYTQFGLVWANPFFVAAQRRGADLLGHGHHRAMLDWYLHTMVPSRDAWLSTGDGGDRGPAIWTLAMWRYFFPADPKARALWNSLKAAEGDKAFTGNFHVVEALIWAADDPDLGKELPADGSDITGTGLPALMFDPERGALIARSGWKPDHAWLQFECRVDSVGASHEHADRGHFSFAALGRVWSKDNFRSVETRHHSSILVDGLGQGYWPGPGVWLGLQDFGDLLVASCDAREAYAWFWPKQILTENPDTFVRFPFARWESYGQEARDFQKKHGALTGEKDTRPSVVRFWQGFEKSDPRLWDEDAWPVRYPHNPVAMAFRTVAFDRGRNPWLLVVDDIRKDDKERLYEWLMQAGMNTEMASIQGNDIILCDATVQRDAAGVVRPQKGDRQLLVRILSLNDPAAFPAYQSRPSARLEIYERRDTLAPEASGLAGSRSFGLDKRLVIPSRSSSPDFRILLYPFRVGEDLPETSWNEDRSRLSIRTPSSETILSLHKDDSGRTLVSPEKIPTPQ
jgi:hypothetical protein